MNETKLIHIAIFIYGEITLDRITLNISLIHNLQIKDLITYFWTTAYLIQAVEAWETATVVKPTAAADKAAAVAKGVWGGAFFSVGFILEYRSINWVILKIIFIAFFLYCVLFDGGFLNWRFTSECPVKEIYQWFDWKSACIFNFNALHCRNRSVCFQRFLLSVMDRSVFWSILFRVPWPAGPSLATV